VLNSGLVNNSAVPQLIGNAIAGSGSLQQNGSSTLTLTSINTYTGGTTINSGTLKIGNGGTTGSIIGDVVDNGTLVFNQSGSGQTNFDGKISGTGSVVVQYGSFSGFVFLTGDNTYTGGTTIASGTLVIGNKGTTGSVVGNIVDNELLTFNRADSITFDGLISGSGGMTKFGAGTLTLTADNTYTNGTVIAEGTLQLGNGGATGSFGSSTLNDGGMLVFNHSNVFTFGANLFGTGAVTQLGSGTTVLSHTNTYDGGTLLKAGTLDLAAAGAAGHGAITFAAGSQTLRIESAAFGGTAFSNTLASFGVGDVIDLRGLVFASGATASYDVSSHTLTVTSGGVPKSLIVNNPEITTFKATDDGFGGTEVTSLISGVHWIATSDIGTHPAGWVPLSTADFNHDATADVLWFNASNLDVDLWKLSNAHWAGSTDIGTHPTGYNLIGPGDFNHDGTPDLLWYNPTNGDVDIWKISNGQWAGIVAVGPHPLGAQPLGDGDFNGDHTGDVLWYNASTNGAEVWMIQNGQWAASVDIGTHPAGWQPFASADIDRDGTSDLLWYNPATRDIDVWKIVNGHWAGSTDIGTHPAGYAPAGVGDFNGDGTPDIAWFNPTTGNLDIWLIANGHWAGSVDLGNHPAGWSPAGTGDFNHDGHLDLLWREPTTNHVEAWLLSNS
jgi:autotransporter-associated beta strand protein